nr:hypothetical protein [Tanacetum cinerariifolium]
MFNMEEDIIFLERFLSEDPFPLPSMNLNQAKSSIEEPEHSFSMGYENFSTNLVTELDEVAESCIKNLVPIPRECEVTSNEIESNEPVKDDSSVFTTFSNPLCNDSDDFTSNEDENVPIEESKVHSNPLFDNDEINSDELEKKHAEYISRMEMLFTINPRSRPTVNPNTIVKSIPSSLIPIQDNDSQWEEIDIVTNTDDVLPPGFENDDSDGEIDVVEELHVDNSISNSENELSDSEESDFDNPSFPRPPPTIVMSLNVLTQEMSLMFLQMMKMTIAFLSCLSSEFFSHILSVPKCFFLFYPLRVRTPSLTLVSPFRASVISLGWNFHVLLCSFRF